MTDAQEAIGILADDGEPWPRKIVCHGYANMEMRADSGIESSEWWIDACNRALEDAGVRLADGEQWRFEWSQISQHEIDIEDSVRAKEGMEPTWMKAGDWRYRAVARVVPV